MGGLEPLERLERLPHRTATGKAERIVSVPTLYLQDIDHIYEILASYSDDVRVTTDQYNIRSIDQLTTIPSGYVRELTLEIFNPRVSLRCDPSRLYLSIGAEDSTSLEAFHRIREVISQRESWLLKHLYTRPWYVIYIAGFLAISALSFFTQNVYFQVIGYLLWSLAFMVPLYWRLRWWERRRDFIVLKNEKDAPSYWERNRDAITAPVIVWLVTVGAVAFLAWFISTVR